MFQVPVCVQPMKGKKFVKIPLIKKFIFSKFGHIAIAAVVLTKHMSINENMAAGLCKLFYLFLFLYYYYLFYQLKAVGAIIFVLGITRTIHLIGAFTPTPVIKGMSDDTIESHIENLMQI